MANSSGFSTHVGEEGPDALANRAAALHGANALPAPTGAGFPAPTPGSIPRPEGEGASGHADGVESPLEQVIEIDRATGRFRVEPWRLAPDGAHRERTCDHETCPACLMHQAVRNARVAAVTASNILLRAYWRADGEALERFWLEHGRRPKGAEWPIADKEGPLVLTNGEEMGSAYKLVRRVAPDLDPGIASLLARRVRAKWAQVRYQALILQHESPPHFKRSNPLPLRRQELRLRATERSDLFVFSFKLWKGKEDARYELPILAKDRNREILQRIVKGDWRMGDALLEEDRLRPGRWYLRLSYRRPIPATRALRWAAINRGMFLFLAAVTDVGARWLVDGDDIEAYLRQIQRRRRKYQRQVKSSGRTGHGRRRTLKPIEKLSGKAERWRATRCLTIAHRFARWCVQHRVGTVVIEDFSGIRDGLPELLEGGKYVWDRIQEWPYYRLQQAIVSALQAEGIAVRQVSAQNISRMCPKCGHTSPDNIDRRWWKHACKECGYREHLDVAAAQNVLARGRERFGDDEQKKDGNGAGGAAAQGPLEKGGRTNEKRNGFRGRRRKGRGAR